MSCVMSVGGICSSDDGLKISPSQNGQTPHKCQTHRTLRVLAFIANNIPVFSAAAPEQFEAD